MGKVELILKKDNYLRSRNADYCTPEELSIALGVSAKVIRRYLREDARAFNAMQDASSRWKIYKSRGCGAASVDKFSSQCGANEEKCNSDVVAAVVANDYKVGFEPWVGENPRVLILGSLPSDISLCRQTYYANKNNHFWKILRTLFVDDACVDNKEFITSKGIALWDSAHSGCRKGSMDSAFDDETIVPNDIPSLLRKYPTIRTIIFNGKRAEAIFEHHNVDVDCKRIRLISTSAASAKTFEYKLSEWAILKELV